MTDVQFDSETYAAPTTPPSRNSMAQKLVRAGIAKDERQADILILGISVLAIGFAAFLVFSSSREKLNPHPELVPTVAVPQNR